RPRSLRPQPDFLVGGLQEDQVVEGVAVAGVGDYDLVVVAAAGEPAGPGAGSAVAPYLMVEADAEDLIIAGDDVGQIAAREGPRALVPHPDAAVAAAKEDDVVGGGAVAHGGHGDFGAV